MLKDSLLTAIVQLLIAILGSIKSKHVVLIFRIILLVVLLGMAYYNGELTGIFYVLVDSIPEIAEIEQQE